MKKLKNHKRFLYVPGMFSLLVIPLVFWYLGSEYLRENDYRVLGINFPEKNYLEHYPQYNYKIGYNYETIQVPANFSKETEDQYFNLIKKLQERNIDKTGIKFQLSDENTYGDFVKLNDLMLLTEQDMYSANLEDDAFYVIHHKKINIAEPTLIGCIVVPFDDRSNYEIFSSDLKGFIQNLPNSIYLILFGYLILVICAIFKPKIFISFSSKN